LLQACLAQRETAQPAWEKWRAANPDPGAAFTAAHPARRRLRSLLAAAATTGRVDIGDKGFQRELIVVTTNEQRRASAVEHITGEVLAALADAEVEHLLTMGAATAVLAYPAAGLRHVHDIDLLITHGRIAEAAETLSAEGAVGVDSDDRGESVNLVHRSGLPVTLHGRAFPVPFSDLGANMPAESAATADVGGCRTRVPSPAGLLTQVCVWGYLTGSSNLTWAADAWFALDRWPDVDWDEMEETASRCGVQLPLALTLRYLAEELEAPVSRRLLTALEDRAASTDRVRLEALLDAAWPAARARRRDEDGSVSLKSWVTLYRSRMVPAPSYLRATGQAASPGELLGCYLRRPARALTRRMSSRRPVDPT
jgi:hypothetical protein